MKRIPLPTGVCALLASALISTVPFTAWADSAPQKPAHYPDRPINLVVAYPAGGGMDITARTLAQQMERVTGYQFRVENRAGGANLVGNTYVARQAKPDGYTVGILANPTFFQDILIRGGHFKKEDISVIANINFDPPMWSVPTNSPLSKLTIEQVIEQAKQKPESLKIGLIPSSDFEAVERIIEHDKDVRFKVVPFQGGKPTIVAALGNNIDISSNYYAEVQPYIDGGQLKPLVVASTERLKQLPDTPAITELGVKLPANTWGAARFAAVPKDTPEEIKKYLSYIILKTLNEKETQEAFAKVGMSLEPEGAKQAQQEYDKSYKSVKDYYKK